MENVVNKIIDMNKDIFGNVFSVKKINVGFTNTIYDVNDKFIIKICSDINNEDEFKREIEFYNANKNNDLIPMLYYANTEKNDIPYFYEIIEKINGVTLYNVWHTLDDAKREDIIRQLCDAMKIMHSNKGEVYNWSLKLKGQFINLVNKAKELNLITDEEENKLKDVYPYFDDYLKCDEFVLIHNDLHFDNILINDGKIKIIDFERAIYAPRDFELDILYRMIRKPWKFASEETEKFTDVKDYEKIMFYIEKYYPELIVDNLYKRLALYDMIYFLEQYIEYPKHDELKEEVLCAANILLCEKESL